MLQNQRHRLHFCRPFVLYKFRSNYKIICQDNAAIGHVCLDTSVKTGRETFCHLVGRFSAEFKIRDQILKVLFIGLSSKISSN